MVVLGSYYSYRSYDVKGLYLADAYGIFLDNSSSELCPGKVLSDVITEEFFSY